MSFPLQRTTLTLDEAVVELHRDRKKFFKLVQRNIRELVAEKSHKECTTIIGTKQNGERKEYEPWARKWQKRVWKMMWYKQKKHEKPALPDYCGEKLDSLLSEPIVNRVGELHREFMQEHSEVLRLYAMDRIRDSPQLQRVIAVSAISALRSAAEPITEEIKKTFVEVIMMELSGQVADTMGGAVTHLLNDAAIAAFSSVLVSAFHGVLGKAVFSCVTHASFHSGGWSAFVAIAKTVIASMLATGGTAVAAHGPAAVAAAPIYFFLIPIVILVVAWQIYNFPSRMGKKVGEKVVKILKGDFDSRNRSALQMTVEEMLRDNAKLVCKEFASDTEFAQKAVGLTKEMIRARMKAESQSQSGVVEVKREWAGPGM
jgi:hypothetical protein